MTATAIPTGTRRSDAREIDARVGMMVFLASWGMTFATLFFCYAVLRVQSPSWPPPGSPALPEAATTVAWANTALMLASSFVLRDALRRLDAGRGARVPQMLGFVMVCGTLFLALQLETWLDLWRSGVRIQDGIYAGLFYAITTFHGLHVLVGLGLWIWALPSAVALARGAPANAPAERASDVTRMRIRVRSTAMFWNFVDIAWLATFFVVYLA